MLEQLLCIELMNDGLNSWLNGLPLIAILRGIHPDECVDIGRNLCKIGFRLLEIPLNSPEPFKSIQKLSLNLKGKAIIGAGTILQKKQLELLRDSGGKFAVMPHVDLDLIRKAKDLDLVCIPGVSSPSEAFSALDAGADALKVFPAELIVPKVLKAWKAVLPEDIFLLPVGGILPNSMASYISAGAKGFGLGSALYKPGMDAADVLANGEAFVKSWGKIEFNYGSS